MMEFLVAPVVTIIIAIIGFVLKEQYYQIKECHKQLHELKAELMQRTEIVSYVEKEIGKLKVEIKEDYKEVLAVISRLDDKFDNVINIMIEKK